MSNGSAILNPTDKIVDTILHGNNNFVSTLDHLPCDIIRCLWVIQMMNLRNVRLQKRLGELLQNPEQHAAEISRLNRIILRNSSEAECESKYAVNILNTHLNTLQDDREIYAVLRQKLPGWTSEAVEQRWKEWGFFKKTFLERQKEASTLDVFSTFKVENETDNAAVSIGQRKEKSSSIGGNNRGGDNSNGTKKTNLKLKSSSSSSASGSGALKIKLSLKPPEFGPSGIKRKADLSILKKGKVLEHDKKRAKKKSTTDENDTRLPIDLKLIPPPPPASEVHVEEKAPLVPDEPHYCFCGGPSFGRMVACENEKCPREWFHFKCVNLVREPEGAWFCSKTCEEQHRLAMLRKKKKKRRNW